MNSGVPSLDRIAIHRLLSAVEEIRNISTDMPMQTLHILLLVAANPGITIAELIKKTGLSQSSCSRNLALLSKTHRLGKPGLDLAEAREDPRERRRKVVRLTPKGRETVALIADSVR